MESKPKPCKGIGQAKNVKGCGKISRYRKWGLCSECLGNFLFENDLGKLILEKRILKQAGFKLKKERKESDKKQKEKLTNWSAKLQDKINEIVRMIDKDLPCLARGIRGQMHAGHVYARGGNQSMRYNLHNIHRQCAQSNHFQNDDGLLREGVVREYGQKYMDFISELRKTPPLKYSNDQYHAFYKTACRISLRYKKSEWAFELNVQRINERNLVNKELGIYPNYISQF